MGVGCVLFYLSVLSRVYGQALSDAFELFATEYRSKGLNREKLPISGVADVNVCSLAIKFFLTN